MTVLLGMRAPFEYRRALKKSVDSSDTDLTFRVVIAARDELRIGALPGPRSMDPPRFEPLFWRLLKEFGRARQLFMTYCRVQDPVRPRFVPLCGRG